MKVLITGGAGFIGSHLVEAYLERGDEVAVIDSFDPFYARDRKERNLALARSHTGFRRLYEGDIREREFVREAFREFAPEGVVHLAALAGVRPSLESPGRYCDVNLTGTAVVLDESVRADVARVVFASSSSVYGARPRGPFQEDADVDRPLSPYGATKRGGELLCHAMNHSSGLAITCLRIFTSFGPRQRPDLAIHKFARLILAGKPIPIFGDGSAERDFTYVGDIVDGFQRALNRADGLRIYNLGRGEPLTVDTMVGVLEEELGVRAERQYLEPQVGDAPRTWASIERAQEELGYAPRVSYRAGIQAFVQWLREEGECER